MTPTRRPPGWTFWPIQSLLEAFGFAGDFSALRFGFGLVVALGRLELLGFFSSAGGAAGGVSDWRGVSTSGLVSVTVMWQVGFWIRTPRPRARARKRLITGPSSTNADETTS